MFCQSVSLSLSVCISVSLSFICIHIGVTFTLSIASESKSNLADLKLTMQILSAASGVDAKVLFERIDFVISDQTAHSVDVEVLVSKELGTMQVLNQLFCNVHPSLMFNRIIVKHWSQLEHAIDAIKYTPTFL